jgi:hypothetical protein
MKQLTRTLQRLLGVAALAVTLGLGACSDAADVSLLGPGGDGPSESLSLSDDLNALIDGVVPEWTETRSHSKIIGPEGGHVYLDLHYLYVPPGAVAGPTKFTMSLRPDFRMGASLSATSVNRAGVATGPENNVGSAGFRKFVYLTFSYKYATDAPANPRSNIKVVEVLPDGKLIPQPTYVNTFYQAATGSLKHFSDYGLAWPSRTSRSSW